MGQRPGIALLVTLLAVAGLAVPAEVCLARGALPLRGDEIESEPPDAVAAAALFGAEAGRIRVFREEGPPPLWRVEGPDGLLGLIASTWEVAGSVGYSGRPLDVQVAITPEARIAGARLVRHNEPILTLGISTEDIAAYVSAFAGFDLAGPVTAAFEPAGGEAGALPPVIARATVSTGVIRDGILRTARTVAVARGLLGTPAGIDRLSFEPRSWDELLDSGAIARTRVSLDQAREALAGARNPLPAGDAAFLELYAALLDPPTIGRNLLGQQLFTRATGSLGPGDSALMVASRGLHSHRGIAWRRAGWFDRVELRQGELSLRFSRDDYLRVDRLAVEGAPELKEISVFRIPAASGVDPAEPFRLVVRATRPAETGGEVGFEMPLYYALPDRFRVAAILPAEPEPLWRSAWRVKRAEVAGVAVMLLVLGGFLFFQQPFARRPALWRGARLAFLTVTLVWLGWIAGGQLSVVQVVAFLHALLSGFRWETFLIEPVIFVLWGFVALGLLFWGRGVYCGWLCPFGALQELLNEAAQKLKVPQIVVPFVVQERLWAIKYVLFLAILAVSFYSMHEALVLAEAEPFKTAISLRFLRAWPFVAFVAVLLVAGLFIERFYCRYLCPLGAALAIPAKLKLFDWLRRRPQCGRECRLCETKCTVGAIDPIGRINPNECVLCLRCQAIYHDPKTCTVLKARAARSQPRTAA